MYKPTPEEKSRLAKELSLALTFLDQQNTPARWNAIEEKLKTLVPGFREFGDPQSMIYLEAFSRIGIHLNDGELLNELKFPQLEALIDTYHAIEIRHGYAAPISDQNTFTRPIDREALLEAARKRHPGRFDRGNAAGFWNSRNIDPKVFRRWLISRHRSNKPGTLEYPDQSPTAKKIKAILEE